MTTHNITGSEAFDRHRLSPAVGNLRLYPGRGWRALMRLLGLGGRR